MTVASGICRAAAGAGLLLLVATGTPPAAAQELDLSHGGPIAITAVSGIEWRQADHEVIATGDARAVRGGVTVTADRLIAWYRKKGGPDAAAADTGTPAPGQPAPSQPAQGDVAGGVTSDVDTGGNEIYRVEAQGNVHIFTQTDQIWGDQATFDLDQAVMVVTGHDLRLTTPNDVLTARDDLEYWTQRHMAVARGDAVVVTKDARRVQADTLVAYTTDTGNNGQATPVAAQPPQATPVADQSGTPANSQDPLASGGKLKKIEAYGHVVIRTVTDTVTGDRGVYVPDSGISRVFGNVHITRGQNQLNGSEADVNMKTGVSRLLASNTGRVQGLVVPNDQTNQALAAPSPPSAAATGHKP